MTAHQASVLSRRPSQAAGPAEIDVTPVMNMFIILIPFLVSMAVFTHLATHAFSLPSEDGAGRARTADAVPLTVAMAADAVAVVWGDVELLRLAVAADGSFDADRLVAVLAAERRRHSGVDEVVVAVDDGVLCAEVVRCLDSCQAAGYGDVGLAAGTNLDRPRAEVSP